MAKSILTKVTVADLLEPPESRCSDLGDGRTMWDFSYCDLSDLHIADIPIANYNFDSSDFSRARFTRVNLRDCSFNHANLIDFTIEQVHAIARVSFEGANLMRATINAREMLEINFKEAKLEAAKFLIYMPNCSNKHSKYIRLTKIDFTDADLQKAHLRDCDFQESNLARANLCFADFEGGQIYDSCTLKNANIYGAKGLNLTLEQANVIEIKMPTASNFKAFSGSNLTMFDNQNSGRQADIEIKTKDSLKYRN